MSDQSRKEFETYWRTRQLRTYRYTGRECPENWGGAFKADAEAAWEASRAAALEEAAKVLDGIDNYSNPMTATDAADAIRALAAKTGKD